MKQLEGQVRIPSGCAVSAVISREGKRMDGQAVIESMKPMHDRSNGLGGGFAGYGIYPELRDYFALHLFFPGSRLPQGMRSLFERTLRYRAGRRDSGAQAARNYR